MIKKIFLIGNPNVGKSVVFSRLTGVNVITSNYPGTTVEVARGNLRQAEGQIEVIDLPGTYSLEPTSNAEEVAITALKSQKKEEFVIINIIDATNLERNLYLTLELIESGYPVIVALNMCDDTAHRGITIDTVKLEQLIGVPVISTCAVTGVGIKILSERINEAQPQKETLSTHEARWQRIGTIVAQVQQLKHRHHTFREILEDASVRPFTGALMAAAVVAVSFKVVRFIGESLIAYIADPVFFRLYQPLLEKADHFFNRSDFLHHLLMGDMPSGVIDFKQSLGLLTTAPYIEFAMVLPYVIAFYFVLGILEDVGFLPRLAMLLDNVMHKVGLHGFAIIPVLLGFGCNVPGILATRVLESKRERFIAATLISIAVPCVPLQAMIFGLLGSISGFYVTGVYAVLFCVWLILGFILNKIMKGYSPEFLLEIPPYRIPPFSALARKLFWRIKGFLVDALPAVFLGVLLINMLMYFKAFDLVTGFFSPVVTGLFGLPKEAVVALSIGFFRKDVAVGMLMPLGLAPNQLFISVVLLAMTFPCIATFAIIFKELGFRGLVKSTCIMVASGLIVGAFLHLAVLR